MKFSKLTKKTKEYSRIYKRKIKLADELLDLHFGKVKDIKCVRCNKKIKITHLIDCRNQWRKRFNVRGSISDSGISFGLIPKIFNSSTPFVVCKNCRDDIYRFMGKIPDIMDKKVFPQHLFAADRPEDLLKSIKKSNSKIHYKKKEYPYTKRKLEQLQKEAVKAYLKKYPYVKFTIPQLFKICNSGRRGKRVGVWS